MVKQICISIPLFNATKLVLAYAKFLKDLCTVKKKKQCPHKVILTKKVSSILLNKIPIKYAISCIIRDHAFDRALLD